MKHFFLIVSLGIITSCASKKNERNEFSTYYIAGATHKISFFEHYIYLDSTISKEDSLTYLTKIKNYVDTVKDGRPIISVAIIKDKFARNSDGINWPKISRSITFEVRFNEDSLIVGKQSIKEVILRH